MKCLVTGVTGLVGHHLLSQLVNEGHEVVAVGRDLDRLTVEGNYDRVELDLTSNDFTPLDAYGEGWIWFHVASAISGASKEVLDAVNISGTTKLVSKAEELGVNRILLVSSISVYGTSLRGKVSEDAHQSPGSYYGETKQKQEMIVIGSNVPHTIVRPPYIGGPGDKNFLEEFGSRIEQHRMPTFSKDGIISYVDARDLASAMIHLSQAETAINEIYNILSESMLHSEFVQLQGIKLGIDPPLGPRYPYWFAMIIGFFGEIRAKLKGTAPERGISRYRIRTLCRQFVLDDSRLRSTGFEPKYTVSSSIEGWLPTRESI